MARSITLTPKFTPGRLRPWQLWIPATLSDTGKVKRLFYRTKREAETAGDILRVKAENLGRDSMSKLSSARIELAAEAFELLAGRPDSALIEIVRASLDAEARRKASVPWSTLVDEFLATKAARSLNHRRNLGYTKKRFAELGPRPVADISTAELAAILSRMAPATSNLEIRHLKSLFAFGLKRGWTHENPASRLEVAELDRQEVTCFTARQTANLFDYALSVDPGLIPFFTFGFFAGIRPEGELSKLTWQDVHFDGVKPEVEVPASVSKTHRRRFVDLSETALAWIGAYCKAGGKTEGPIVPFTPAVLRAKRRQACAATGIRWIKQGMRHTFCSAWLAVNHDVNRLVLMSGHDDPDTMWRHYHRGMREKEAAKFWAILPPTHAKIIAFQASV
jgi:integrase